MTLDFPADHLPADHVDSLLVGRMLTPDGPSPILIRGGEVFDVSAASPTVCDLVERNDLTTLVGKRLCGIDDLDAATLLSPLDLQCIKAAGVTFAVSAIERVIEERARGDAGAAAGIRGRLEGRLGADMRAVVPGSPEATRLKTMLIDEGLWSQYLEVAIGPDAEIFTKAPVLSSVGYGADVGVRGDSHWNNPEPEIALIVDGRGRSVGATLGNDVNLRDFEGRSALLLGKAKDNNASCALGPFIRMFDAGFTIDDVRRAEVSLNIDGVDGYRLDGASSMAQISRDPLELVRQALSDHQYPDGFALLLGTLFAPIQDRDTPGGGFTHKTGDVVRIFTPTLGTLINTVAPSSTAPPWRFGVRALMTNLAARGLLNP